jgi:hypothetical protein
LNEKGIFTTFPSGCVADFKGTPVNMTSCPSLISMEMLELSKAF